jgi:hypothetical protein
MACKISYHNAVSNGSMCVCCALVRLVAVVVYDDGVADAVGGDGGTWHGGAVLRPT